MFSSVDFATEREETVMRTLIVALGFVAAALPVRAETIAPSDAKTIIAPSDAKTHVGQTVTIHAAVDEVKTGRGGAIFLDMGGSFPDNAFAAVIFASDLNKFPTAKTLKGRTVAISGPVQLYQGKPEIILKTADQLKAD
jgi:DNA/RNA endonuclease YhcR with UshA esterase domain